LKGAVGRFIKASPNGNKPIANAGAKYPEAAFYKISHPGSQWNRFKHDLLPKDGGQKRPIFSPQIDKPSASDKISTS
jgi:hypothetical protein